MKEINLFIEKVDIAKPDVKKIRRIAEIVLKDYLKELIQLNVILVNDMKLKEINKDFLKKDYYTDIISFNYSEIDTKVDGELYISAERVTENAVKYRRSDDEEMFRVIIHGLLHLCGENDNNTSERKRMRALERKYLKVCFT